MALEPITRQEQIIAGKGLEPITRMERFLKKYGGGGGASSWNDLTDKPFGEEVTTFAFVEHQTVEVGEDVVGYLSANAVPSVGEVYTVVLDGTTYNCVAWYSAEWDALIVGNGIFVGDDGKGDDVPFAIDFYDDDGMYGYINTASGQHTVEVYGNKNVIKTIDKKYLPTLELKLTEERDSDGFYKLINKSNNADVTYEESLQYGANVLICLDTNAYAIPLGFMHYNNYERTIYEFYNMFTGENVTGYVGKEQGSAPSV